MTKQISADKKPVILAVDDTPENLDVIKGILTPAYSLRVAVNGELALKIAAEKSPDLILLDVMMPGMDGYEVCRLLKSDERTRDIPVIFVTALVGELDEVKGLKLGAVDYVTKPIVPAILLARVSTQLALQQARRELYEKNQQLEHERELIEQIVLRMRRDTEFDGRFLRYASFSCEQASGDIMLAAFRPDGTQHVLVGDFTGHGLTAAIGGPLVSYIFYSMTRSDQPISDILEVINKVLVKQLPVNIFMATAGIELAPSRGSARIFNFGLPAVLGWGTGTDWKHWTSEGLPLGITDEFDRSEGVTASLSGISCLYLTTDGLLDAADAICERSGLETLIEQLPDSRAQNKSLQTVIDSIIKHAPEDQELDDMTLVEVDISGEVSKGSPTT